MGPGNPPWRIPVLTLIFSGHGPFQLPETASATATSDPPNVVTLTLYSSSQSDAPAGAKEEKALSTQMSPRVARDLAICLWLAADEADSAAKVRLPSQKP
jgi:hypothetical protein